MSAELFNGDMSDFEAAARRCPFLSSLGESVLAEMKVELEASLSQDSQELPLADVAASKPGQKGADREVISEAPPITVSQPRSPEPGTEHRAPVVERPELIDMELPEAVQARLDRDIREVLFEQPEAIPPAPESVAVAHRVQAEVHQPRSIVAAENIPKLELSVPEALRETDSETAHVERAEIEGMESVESSIEIGSGETPEPDVLSAEQVMAPEAPATVVELLAEPQHESNAELGAEELLYEPDTNLEAEPAPPFSTQLERLVTETVEPEQQEATESLIAEVYELVAQANVRLELDETNQEQVADPLELTAELEEAVTELLQRLWVEEDLPEQVERFIALVRAEQRHAPATEDNLAASLNTYDLSQTFSGTVWARYHVFLRLHQPLGRTALTRPIAA